MTSTESNDPLFAAIKRAIESEAGIALPDSFPEQLGDAFEEDSSRIANSAGAAFKHNYIVRNIDVYCVTEEELSHFTTWNTLSGVCFSGWAAFASFSLTLMVEDSMNSGRTPEATVLMEYAVPASGIISVTLFFLGIFLLFQRGGTLRRMKRQVESESTTYRNSRPPKREWRHPWRFW